MPCAVGAADGSGGARRGCPEVPAAGTKREALVCVQGLARPHAPPGAAAPTAGVGSSEGPVLPVPDARGRVSCQQHHLPPGSSLGAVLPTLPGGISGSRSCASFPSAVSPGHTGLRSLSLAPIPFSPRFPSPGRWLPCLLGQLLGQRGGAPACPPAGWGLGRAAGAGHGYFRCCHPGCNLGCLLFSPPPPPPPLARSVFPSPPQVIKNSASGVKFLTL